MPPVTNATLLTIRARGSTDTFHDSAAEGDVLFDGSVGAWVDERRQRQLTDTGANVHVWKSLLIDPLGFDIDEGLEVVFEYKGTEHVGTVQAVEAPEHPHVPDELNTVRLTLDVA